MADKIKNFFARKKADAKFKRAGPGQRLNDATSTMAVVGPSSSKKPPPPKRTPTEATRQAAEAALARSSNKRKDTAFNTSLAAIQAQVRKELENESKDTKEFVPQAKPEETEMEASPHLAVQGVYYRCPLVSEEILNKDEWKVKIKDFLYSQLEEERGLTACLIINSCNYNRSKVTDCVSILCRYLDNIIANPDETKFHKIRRTNATYVEKVQPVLGTQEFLYAAGFRQQEVENNDAKDSFWVWSNENLDILQSLRETLVAGERVELEIDRNIQVLSPSQASARVELPREFYALSADELKREYQNRAENAEKQMQLRTKAMREKEELREIKKYKFAIIRVRYPDGLYLQGTFSVYEKFSEVLDFVRDNLDLDLPFILSTATGQKFGQDDAESTLFQLRLVPATILLFKWDDTVELEIQASGHTSFLKPEVMMLMQSL